MSRGLGYIDIMLLLGIFHLPVNVYRCCCKYCLNEFVASLYCIAMLSREINKSTCLIIVPPTALKQPGYCCFFLLHIQPRIKGLFTHCCILISASDEAKLPRFKQHDATITRPSGALLINLIILALFTLP